MTKNSERYPVSNKNATLYSATLVNICLCCLNKKKYNYAFYKGGIDRHINPNEHNQEQILMEYKQKCFSTVEYLPTT